VEALRIGGGGANARAAHALDALACALRARVIEIRLDEELRRPAAIDAREKKCGRAFEDGQGTLTHQIGEADIDGFLAAANCQDEIGVRIELDVKARRAAFAAETRKHSLKESGGAGKVVVSFFHREWLDRS